MLKPLSRAKAMMLVNEIMSQHSNYKAQSLLVEPMLKHRSESFSGNASLFRGYTQS